MLIQDGTIQCAPLINLSDTVIFYVEPFFDPRTNAYFEANYDKIHKTYEDNGLELVYLPKFKDNEIIRYLTGSTEEIETNPLLAFQGILPDEVLTKVRLPSLVHYSIRNGGFDIAVLDVRNLDEFHLNLFLETNAKSYGHEHRVQEEESQILTRFSLDDSCRDIHFSFVEDEDPSYYASLAVDWYVIPKNPLDDETSKETDDVEHENKQMIAKIQSLLDSLESRGLRRELIFKMLSRPVKPSSIKVCKDKIILSEFDNKEVKLAALDFSFYVLYLRHPEGIRFKDVIDYEAELLSIYKSVQQRRCRIVQEKTISNFVDSTRNLMSISASRIKNAFKAVVDESLAEWYCISGAAGETKLVRLPQAKIEWDI